MITTLLGLLAMQLQANPALVRPLPPPATVATTALLSRKERLLGEGRALLARAEQVNAAYAPAPGQPPKAELDAAVGQMKSELDSMSEMGEMESLRLQMAMDRMSKMMATLSNLLQKVSDTQDAIVQNIK